MRLNRKYRDLYQELVEKHSDTLYRFAFRMCGSSQGAEDILQDTFYEAWCSIHSLKDVTKAKAWLFQILRYRYAHWVRDKIRRSKVNLSLDKIESSLIFPDPDILNSIAEKEIIEKSLEALSVRYKEPFLLVFLHGFSCKEVAEQLNIPLGTVLSRIHRARLFLRNFITKIQPDSCEK